ncbi:unnamed protein product [Caenorhabditis angaria]|uniref:Uncharacterized protein n=1 Tax=Caenorhabditis angaria TaxID=860376 RepID=A0A9P1IH02_9PELO|nr:unnamed protein product [Caenorhabditis angaria]
MTIVVVIKIRAFHINVKTLLLITLFQWYESIYGKWVLKPYVIGISFIGQNQTFNVWWDDDSSRFVQISKQEMNCPIFLAGFIYWHYITSLLHGLFVLSIERIFACVFIANYEKKSRPALLFSLITMFFTLPTITTLISYHNIYPFLQSFSICFFSNVLAIIILILTFQYNNKLLERFMRIGNSTKYTLASRFQARENRRTFRLLFNFLIAAFFLVFTSLILVLLMVFEITPNYHLTYNYLLENIIHLYPLIVCPVIITSVDRYLMFFKKAFNINRRKTVPMKVRNSVGETDLYFSQLKMSWK